VPPADGADVLDTSQAGPAAVRGGTLRVLGYGAGVLLSILSAALLFRHLGVADGGRYVTVLALVGLVASVSELGLTTVGVRELAIRHSHEREAFMRNLLGLRIGLTLVGALGAVAFALLADYTIEMVLGAVLGGVSVVALAVQSTLGIRLMVDLRLGWMTALEVVRQIASVAGIVALVVAEAGLLAFFAVPVPAAIVALSMTAILVRGEVPLLPNLDVRGWLTLLRQVIPAAAATAVTAVYFRVSILVFALIASARETGFFGASFRVIEVLALIPNLVVGAALPILARAARDDLDRLNYALDRVFRVCVLLGTWIALALALGASVAIDVVGGSEFRPSADVLRIQGLALAASFPGAAFFYGLLSLHRNRTLLLLMSGALLLNAVLVVALGSALDAKGAALATVIAETIVVVAAGLLLRAATPHWHPALGVVARCALAGTIAASLVFVPWLSDVPLVVAATGIYLALVLLLRAVPAELTQMVGGRARAVKET
jgi:O-antigen/teichoic acid export membrane protein